MSENREHESPKKMRDLGETLTPHKYTANYVRMGEYGKARKNALFRVLRNESGELLSDHVWLPYTTEMKELRYGERVEFVATPVRYIRGFHGSTPTKSDFSTDVKLVDVRDLKVIVSKRPPSGNDKQ